MERVGMRPTDLRLKAKAIGLDLSQQRISNWRNGINDPKAEMLPILAKILKVTVDDLLTPSLYVQESVNLRKGKEAVPEHGQTEINVPHIQTVQPGSSWTDPLNSDHEMSLPSFMVGTLAFCCAVDGDSMSPFLQHGDIAVFRQEHTPKVGRIVIARTLDGDITIKKLTHDGMNYILAPLNSKYCAVQFKQWRIEGFLTGILRDEDGDVLIRHNSKGLRP